MMYSRLQISCWVAPVVLAALGAACTQGAAANPAHAHQHTNVLARILHELHQAKHLLHGGVQVGHKHRARAEAEITQAIHSLEQHPHHKTTHDAKHHAVHVQAPHHKAAKQKGPLTEAQLKTADSKLRQAAKMVHAAMHQLHQLHSKAGNKHHSTQKASHLLKHASHEIQAAMHSMHAHEKQLAAAVANHR